MAGRLISVSLFTLWPVLITAAETSVGETESASKAFQVLQEHCHRCHGGAEPESDLNILDHTALTTEYIVANDLESSEAWTRIVAGEMPPDNPLNESDKQTIRDWILQGAPKFPIQETRQAVTEAMVLAAIEKDLTAATTKQRRSYRYFSLHNIYNNSFSERVGRGSINSSTNDVLMLRMATAKLINSLSWQPDCEAPQKLDPAGVVLRIDLEKYGWDEKKWLRLLRDYHFAREIRSHREPSIASVASSIHKLRQGVHPKDRSVEYVRADWFVNHASRNELYYELLAPPNSPQVLASISSLESFLRVNPHRDFLDSSVVRAGFRKSNVSNHNRLVERYSTRYGAYWKSYDFRDSNDTRDVIQNPLGPDFPDNPFSNNAFEFDGGEMIFNLPNGMQAYMLANAVGSRLVGDAPIEIVQDKTQASGGPVVVNAISCFSCHQNGMVMFTDDIRSGHSLSGLPARHIARIFPAQATLDEHLQKDSERFMTALNQCYQGLADESSLLAEDAEPMRHVAIRYQGDLQAEEIAIELGITDVSRLIELIDANPNLQRLGLRSVTTGGGIKRVQWEQSIFNEMVVELGLGTPIY